MENKSPWEILGVNKDASSDEVMKAYRNKMAAIDLEIAELEQKRLDATKATAMMKGTYNAYSR